MEVHFIWEKQHTCVLPALHYLRDRPTFLCEHTDMKNSDQLKANSFAVEKERTRKKSHGKLKAGEPHVVQCEERNAGQIESANFFGLQYPCDLFARFSLNSEAVLANCKKWHLLSHNLTELWRHCIA